MRVHLSFATTDLPKSVAFYGALLGSAPAKSLPDYALFLTDEPALELALDASDAVEPALDAHYGVAVASTDDVDRAIERLTAAALPIDVERDATCCYARQTKVWATDPEGRRWEIYTVHEETAERNDAANACC